MSKGGVKMKLPACLKKEPVLTVAAGCAVLSMLAVPPDAVYLTYIDWRTLGLLFSLMTVVAGLEALGLFRLLGRRLLSRCATPRSLTLTLTLLPFFLSMLVTNDVALLTFVPFALLVLRQVGRSDLTIRTVLLQTLAANLGSMATPVGNPQNLFLSSYYGLTAAQFFSTVLPPAAAALLLLTAAALLTPSAQGFAAPGQGTEPPLDKKRLALYLVLFALSLGAVFRLLPWPWLVLLVALCVGLADRPLLKKVDYALLLTFVCFFLFAGNLGRIPQVRAALEALLSRSTLLTAALASQVISNVPAAVLLAGFTADWRGLLLGVDLGGLGTPIASLASLISLKFYLSSPESRPRRYLFCFLLANFAMFFLLFALIALL